jgi:acyl-CoA synthetase (AMP-forming)/AMP-acid ligase II
MTGQNTRVSDWLRINAANFPDRPCFVDEQRSLSFAEVNSRVNRIATSLRDLGVRRGDRVALFATDSPEYMEVVLACTKLSAVYVPLNFRLAQPELEMLLRTAEAKVLFFSDRYADMVAACDVPSQVCALCLE